MRLHSSTLTRDDIAAATRAAGMTGVHAEISTHGSRVAARGFEVKLFGTSPRMPNTGRYGGGRYGGDTAATWDEWGMFLAALFDLDPAMIVGPGGRPAYADAAAFHAATCDRYRELTADRQHRTHRWQSNGAGWQLCAGCDAEIDRSHMYVKAAR